MKNFFSDKIQEKKDLREFWNLKRQEEKTEEERHEESLELDLQNTCPRCYIIRSVWEIKKGTCDSCDFIETRLKVVV